MKEERYLGAYSQCQQQARIITAYSARPINYKPQLFWNDPLCFTDTSILNSMGRPYDKWFVTISSATQTESNHSKYMALYKQDECCLHVWCLCGCGRLPRLRLRPYILRSAPLLNNLIISQWSACIIYTTKGEWQCQNASETMVSSLSAVSKGFSVLSTGELMIKLMLLWWLLLLNSPLASISTPDKKALWLLCVSRGFYIGALLLSRAYCM